jgi:glutamate carboxypeptidase
MFKMSNNSKRIVDYLHEEKPGMVEFLRRLVVMESPSLEPTAQKQVFSLIADKLGNLGYEARLLSGERSGGHLYVRPRQRVRGQAAQLLLGHCDTVWPLGTLTKMPLEITNGVMKGPGVYDMKAGLAQIVFALQALNDLQLQPTVTPLVLITSDEEVGSFESRRHIERIARNVNRALVLEPSLGLSGKLKTARKGVGRFEILVNGKPAHAGLEPEEGASAVLELSHVIQKLFALNNPERGITVNVGTINGGLRSNVIAPESRASVDVRVLTTEDGKWIEETIRNLKPSTPGVTLEIAGAINRYPMERTARNQALWNVARKLGSQIGLELEQGISGGASDGNFTTYFTATLDGLGAVGNGAHAYHEFVDVEKTLERCALLALLMLEPPV